MATRILTFGLPLQWQRATVAIKIFEASKLKRLITLIMSIKARLRFDHLDGRVQIWRTFILENTCSPNRNDGTFRRKRFGEH